MIGRAEQERERREALRQKKIAMEMEQCKTTAKRKARSDGGKPYWERFYERRNETETNTTLMTSEERELKEHCTLCSSAKRENLYDSTFSSYHENVKCIARLLCITHLYHKRSTPTATLKCTLNSTKTHLALRARTQVRVNPS